MTKLRHRDSLDYDINQFAIFYDFLIVLFFSEILKSCFVFSTNDKFIYLEIINWLFE